jgi:hypothetical protein
MTSTYGGGVREARHQQKQQSSGVVPTTAIPLPCTSLKFPILADDEPRREPIRKSEMRRRSIYNVRSGISEIA